MADAGAQLLIDLALVTGVAALTTLVFHRLKQPVVVGYLLAGFVVGPHSPGIQLTGASSVEALSQLGIVFLMFSIGLEFRLRRVARAGLLAIGTAAAGMAAVALATLAAARLAGWSTADGLFLAAILAISSTVIAAKAILERGHEGERWAGLALAVLLVQDIAAVAVLAILGAQGPQPVGVVEVVGVLGRLATFAMAALVLGLLFVPRLITRLAHDEADEVLVVTLAGLALGTAVLAVMLGFSPALGAFLMGAVVAEARASWHAVQRVLPLRDLFTAIFFVSIGMLLDPAPLLVHWRAALGLAALMVAVKVAGHTVPAFLLGAPPRTAFRASLSLAQIGEFSFVIAALGLAAGVVSDFVLPVTVAIATASALWTPYLLRHADPLERAAGRVVPRPLRVRALRYQAWLAARARPRRWATQEVRRLGGRALMNGAAALLLLLATGAGSRALAEWVTVQGVTDRTLALLPWLAGGVLALPFGFIAARSLHSLLRLLRGPRPAPGRVGRAARSALTLLLAAGVLFGALLLAAPFLPPTPLLLFSLAAFLGAAVVLWEAMAIVQGKVERALERALEGGTREEERQAVLDALRDRTMLGAEVATVRVPPASSASGSTIAALALRARTGASLVAVRRAGRTLLNPSPDTVLEPGDALVLLGEPRQLERARALLAPSREDEAPAPRIAELLVEAASPLAGLTLAESGLRERTGATIVGIVRGGERLANPGAATRIQPGDVLLVMGAEEHMRAASEMARAAPGEAHRAGSAAGPNV